MRILILCFLFLLPFISRGQGSMGSIQQAMQLFDKGDFEGTIKVAVKAIPQVKQEFGEKSPFYDGLVMFVALSHFRLYQYKEAEPWFVQHIDLVKQINGESSAEYMASLNMIAQIYRELGKYNDAESSYLKGAVVAQKIYGLNDTSYAKNQNNLASLYDFMGRYTQAEQLYEQCLQILKMKLGENSAQYATALNNLSTLYTEIGQLQKAKTTLQKVLSIRKAVLGDKHPDYAGAMNNYAYLLNTMGDYKEAEKYYLGARQIYLASLGDQHPDYAANLNNLANLYKNTGKYELAERLLNESLNIRKKVLGENHLDYAISLSNLADLYEYYGQYEKAEAFLLRSDSIIRRNYGDKHPSLVTSLNNLAALYDDMGDYVKAEPLYLKAKDLRKDILGDQHPSYALSLNNLGTFYMEIGLSEKAEPLFLNSKQIWEKSLGTKHVNYATCLNNLGAVYEENKDYEKATTFYTQAKDIYKALFGVENADHARALNNLAGVYVKKGEYKKAEVLLIQARDIWKKTLGENNPDYITCINNIAALYRKGQFNLGQSEQLYQQSLSLRKKILGVDHPRTVDVENDLALLYMNLKMPEKAIPLFLHSSESVRKNLVNTFPVLSEKEKNNFISQALVMNDCNNSFLYLNPVSAASMINNNVDLQIFFKSLSLSDTRNLFNSIRNSRDTTTKRIFGQWQALRALLAKQESMPVEKRSTDLRSKEEEVENLEKELSRISTGFRQQKGSLRISMKEIQNELANDEAVIEFVSFKLINKKITDSVIYGAYIYRKSDDRASFVPLFEEKQLQQLLDSGGHSPTGVAKSFYRGGIASSSSNTIGLDKALYQLIWQPLEMKLTGIKRIAYSPSGKLYGIAFHALRADSTQLLMDRYALQQYSSTRDISLRSSSSPIRPGPAILMGNADFTMDSTAIVKKRKGLVNAFVVRMNTESRGGNGIWADLPGTGDELKLIAELFKKKKIAFQQFQHAEASEENLKKAGLDGPAILHIATHGFFLPVRLGKDDASGNGNAYMFSSDPMIRSGLVLAGGNYVWSGHSPIEGAEDGILTAYEIAQLNLSNTGLVVLSACETALGDIKCTEGVFGLQRAFKMAGAKKMLLSLWQVPDKETGELMGLFYNYWLGGKTLEDSFLQAQADMRKKYSPYYWAAFVLIN